MRQNMFACGLMSASLLWATVAHAEDAGETEDYLDKPWIATIEFGLLVTTGNTENRSVKGKIDATQDLPKWRTTYQAEAFNARDRNDTTAERYRLASQADYKLLDPSKYLFGRISATDDRFSGYDYEITSSLGYGFRAWEKELNFTADHAYLDLEAGPGYRFAKIKESQLSPGQDDNERAAIVRIAAKYVQPLSPNAQFSQTLSSEISVIGDDNIITEAETALISNLISTLAMKLGVTIRRVEQPPQGKKPTDTETSISLIYTL